MIIHKQNNEQVGYDKYSMALYDTTHDNRPDFIK